MKRLIAITLCLFLIACSSSERKENVLRLVSEMEFRSLDPRVGNDAPSVQVILMLFEGLFRKDRNDMPKPAICSSYDISPNKTRYTFYLKQTTWSDGYPVTAMDFEYAWKKVVDPAFATNSAYRFYAIKNAKKIVKGRLSPETLGVRALDAYTLQVDLEYPAPYFLSMLTTTVYFPIPKHIVKHNPRWAFSSGGSFVSNGPFALVENHFKQKIRLEKNQNYWDKRHVYLSGIELDVIPDVNTQYAMYQKGEIDYFGKPFAYPPCDTLAHVRHLKDFHTEDLHSIALLFANTKKPILNNTNFRQALAHALNRREILDHLVQEPSTPAMDAMPAALTLHPAPYFQDNDVPVAKEYLQKALDELGLTLDQLPTFDILFTDMRKNKSVLQAIQDQLRVNLGIHMTLTTREWSVVYQDATSGNFDLVFMSWFARIPDAEYMLETFKYGTDQVNFTKWEDARFIESLDKARESIDVKERYTHLHNANNILMDAMPLIPIYHAKQVFLANPNLTGYTTSKLYEVDFKSAKFYHR